MDNKSRIEISLNPRTQGLWAQIVPDSFVRGFAFNSDEYWDSVKLGQELLRALAEDNLEKLLKKLNGNFSAILTHDGSTYLISDKIRSYALLYSIDFPNIVVADGGHIANKIENRKENELSIAEFLTMGYLIGSKTLLGNVKSVVAGTYVRIKDSEIIIKEYYNNIFKKNNADTETLLKQAEINIENAFKRLLKAAGGRQLVIPLSGGYDSRLIACLCKKYNVSDVVCFTYGKKGSWEVDISKKVADCLGFQWHFIEYHDSVWLKICGSEVIEEYEKFAGNLNSVPHLQDFPAFKYLVDNGLIDDNAVVLPGHSGDALVGGHLPTTKHVNVMDYFFKKYYKLNNAYPFYTKMVLEELEIYLDNIKIKNNIERSLDIFTDVLYKVRQSHFIINSVRAYEYFERSWLLLFWDADVVEFWGRVPYDKKIGSTLFHELIFKYFKEYDVAFVKPKLTKRAKVVIYLRRNFSASIFRFIIKLKKSLPWKKNESKKDINNYDAIVRYYNEKNQVDSKIFPKSPTNINGVVAVDYLRLMNIKF